MGNCCSDGESGGKNMDNVRSMEDQRNEERLYKQQHQAGPSGKYVSSHTANSNNKEKGDTRKKKKNDKQGSSSNDKNRQLYSHDGNNRYHKELLEERNANEKLIILNRKLTEEKIDLDNRLQKELHDKTQLQKNIQSLAKESSGKEDRYRRELDDKKNEISRLQKQKQTLEKDIYENEARYNRNIENLKRKTNSLNTELEKVKQEKGDLLTRYSALAGSRLTDGNANIADLSDENRPTKLAEKYSELYDNEWTEAFTILSSKKGRTEEDVCSILVNVFCLIYSTCRKEAKNEWKAFISATKTLFKEDELPQEMVKAAKDKRKKSPGVSPEIIKKSYDKDMRKIIHVEDQTKIEMFLHKSIDLCWMMAIQDPPVYVDTNLSLTDSPLDKNLFKPYTSNGNFIDFVVWPTLYLNEGGSVLSKGIAQGKKSKTRKQEYHNEVINPKQPALSESSVREQSQNIATSITKESSDKENATPECHSKRKDKDISPVIPASSSLNTLKGQISTDCVKEGPTTENAITKLDSQTKPADASFQNTKSKSITSKDKINVVGQNEDSRRSAQNNLLKNSSSDRDIKSQSHPMNLSEWKSKQAAARKTQDPGKHKTVLHTTRI